jgi:hypothetical protein
VQPPPWAVLAHEVLAEEFALVMRAFGRASVSDDPTLLGEIEVNAKPPKLAVVILLHQGFFHCGKRSGARGQRTRKRR